MSPLRGKLNSACTSESSWNGSLNKRRTREKKAHKGHKGKGPPNEEHRSLNKGARTRIVRTKISAQEGRIGCCRRLLNRSLQLDGCAACLCWIVFALHCSSFDVFDAHNRQLCCTNCLCAFLFLSFSFNLSFFQSQQMVDPLNWNICGELLTPSCTHTQHSGRLASTGHRIQIAKPS